MIERDGRRLALESLLARQEILVGDFEKPDGFKR